MNKRFFWDCVETGRVKKEKGKKKDGGEMVKKKEKGLLGREVTHKTTPLKKTKCFLPMDFGDKCCHMVGGCDKGAEISFALLKSRRREI